MSTQEAVKHGHRIVLVLDNLDDKSAMEMMQFVIAMQNWASSQSAHAPPTHDEDDEGETAALNSTHMGSVTLLMPCETIISLRKYARAGEFPSDPEQEHTIIHKFDVKALSLKEQKVLFQRVLQSRGMLSIDRETCGNALEKKQEQAESPLYLVTLGVTACSILERKLAGKIQLREFFPASSPMIIMGAHSGRGAGKIRQGWTVPRFQFVFNSISPLDGAHSNIKAKSFGR